LPDWISSHVRAFSFYGGVSEIVVNDNLKAGVIHPCRYEPELNPTYRDLAKHYKVAILPARVRKPRDKAKVETGVQLVERWILAPLRHCQFFSLHDLNQAIRKLVDELNQRPFQKLPGCRRSLFGSLDQPALNPLPLEPYEYAEWKKARVNLDYHIEVEGHYYSVPYRFLRQQVEVRLTARTLECFLKNKRICSHRRNSLKGRYTTLKEHMPKSHREYGDWTPERLMNWAEKIGPDTHALVKEIMQHRLHPVQGFRSCLGILRLAKKHGAERLEKACRRARAINAYSYKSVQSILKTGLETRPLPKASKESSLPCDHANLRGAHYFN
jgi:transposase